MAITLGLDIGTNSVGSAWVDTDQKLIDMGVGVFPAGIEDGDEKSRGEPKGRDRRAARMARRILQRRGRRKKELVNLLIERGFLPADEKDREELFGSDPSPWHLRRKAVLEKEKTPLTPFEFGRVLVHLNQRRGAFGIRIEEEEVAAQEPEEIETDTEESKKTKKAKPKDDEGRVKESIGRVKGWLNGRTFGQAIADEFDNQKRPVEGKEKKFFYAKPIRNRRESYEYCASREMIRDEFRRIWDRQKELGGELAEKLTDDFKRLLDDPNPSDPKVAKVWRHAGIIFGQRRHYWDIGTLGRCKLEPTDRCCPLADRHAQYFRVIETVNNIRLWVRGCDKWRPLSESERDAVIRKLREQKTASIATIRQALGIDRKSLKKKGETEDCYKLNIEADAKKEINTDWFWREIVLGAIGEETWAAWDENRREAVNLAILRLDPETPDEDKKLRDMGAKWWGLSPEQADRLVEAWRKSPAGENRLKLSRKAICNLLPYLGRATVDRNGEPIWPTVTDARQAFAEDTANKATLEQRARYAFWITEILRSILLTDCAGDEDEVRRLLSLRGLTSRDRHYLTKHPGELPPVPVLANPVVRRSIFEVRKHVVAYLKKYGRKPDRIVIELTRDATQPKKLRDQELFLNRSREAKRKEIIAELGLDNQSKSQREKAVDRVLLCRQQKGCCAYSGLQTAEGLQITERDAALGLHPDHGALEIDHIIPRACGGGDDWSNLVLCYVKANRDKGRQSPMQWLDPASFEQLEKRFEHLLSVRKGIDETGYFTTNDCKRKWENLHRDAKDNGDDWRPSQLTDTSYAATEVARYLQAALYPEEPVDVKDVTRRKIIFTKGRYTAKLRRDWQLFQTLKDKDGVEGEGVKDRFDHRHHAIDAAVIALTNERILQEIGRSIRQYDEQKLEARERGQDADAVPKPSPTACPAPWGSVAEFRRAVLSRLFDCFDPLEEEKKTGAVSEAGQAGGRAWAVSHRPRKRKIVEALHQATLYGPVPDDKTKYTCRVSVLELKPGYLKLSETQRQAIISGKKPLAKDDPAIDRNSYLVRDLELRLVIRRILAGGGLDPDHFTDKDIKSFVENGRMRFPNRGVPIKSVVCLRTIKGPVRIPSKKTRWSDGRADRVYIGGNNHHIEIREITRTSKGQQIAEWSGEVVSTFQAARRNIERHRALKKAGVPSAAKFRHLSKEERARFSPVIAEINRQFPIVDRRDNKDGRFIMSLAEGETIWMRHKVTGEPGYFVVFQIDPTKTIHFMPHWDARRAKGEKSIDGSKREEIPVVPSDLRTLGVDPGKPPVKVRVSPLGEVTILEHD